MNEKLKFVDISSNKEAREANGYWKRRSERKKNIRMKKIATTKKRMKMVAAAAAFAAMAYLALLGKDVSERIAGENYILDTFTSSDDRYDKISVADFSNGLSVAMTDKDTGETKYVSIDDAVNYIIKRANNEGMSEAESYIVVSSYLSELVAKQAFPSVTYEDVTNAQKSAYYKLELAKADGRGATR